MFLVDRSKNEAVSLAQKTFQELGFRERKHLQEWICKNPEMIGERLCIIQKEFSGFDDTNERLDLLAVDVNGDLVIIENKLDDTGRDVTWQALKYVSYCSGLTKADVIEMFQKYLDAQGQGESAEETLAGFLEAVDFEEAEINSGDQRMILIAASFRKEVTSTVMWLLNHNVKIKCIKVTPYIHGDEVFLDTEQIIPVKDTEDYLIKLANKKQEELIHKEKNQSSHALRMRFWGELLRRMNEKTDLFKNISPSTDNWLTCSSGYSGVVYDVVVTKHFARVEVLISGGNKEENKQIYDRMFSRKEQIETAFGHTLDWMRLSDNIRSKIVYDIKGVNVYDEDDWDTIISFLTEHMPGFEKAIKSVLPKVLKG